MHRHMRPLGACNTRASVHGGVPAGAQVLSSIPSTAATRCALMPAHSATQWLTIGGRRGLCAAGLARDVFTQHQQTIEGDPISFLSVTEAYWEVRWGVSMCACGHRAARQRTLYVHSGRPYIAHHPHTLPAAAVRKWLLHDLHCCLAWTQACKLLLHSVQMLTCTAGHRRCATRGMSRTRRAPP
jgi:hypothetical protein